MIIPIETPSHSYEVSIGERHLTEALQSIKEKIEHADQLIMLTDENVWHYHQDYFEKNFPFEHQVHVMPAGEACKTFENYMNVQTYLLEQKATRKTMLFALGGGAVGDLVGFVAASYMRGIPFVQIPTTILAHDSAVGGKTAINHPLGKNMIGAFYQPQAVLYDIHFLTTLPKREVRSGMAETVKHALISNDEWLSQLLAHTVYDFKGHVLESHLEKGIQVKASIVKRDEEEHSVRKFLNFGHTYGHAIEAASGFGKVAHGEAVMIGIIYALLLSENYGELDHSFTKKMLTFARQSDYPFEAVSNFTFDELLTYMMKDKKVEFGQLQFVLLRRVGEPFVQTISADEARETDVRLRRLLQEVTQ
ncbi:3-dehydroquinate synthase [Kurthia senegalensis]|uniref:3-dehydroquinate synthase n=1 Tax=Kurthia senegalensis TaxID=1033740 RepID=UPI000289D971|nr:3-dehydroquinate synthase [Kurthia senegalensis]